MDQQTYEILVRARAETDAAFQQVISGYKEMKDHGDRAGESSKQLAERLENLRGNTENVATALQGSLGGALKTTSSMVEELLGSSGMLFGTMGVGVGVALELADKFGNWGNALENVHVKTGLSVAVLNSFNETQTVTGVGAEQMGLSLQRLGMQIENNAQAARDGATKLGISFEELRAASPEERLKMISEAFAKVGVESDVAQAAAKGLFGKGGLGDLPAFSAEAVEYREHIHELSTSILGDEEAAAKQAKEWKEAVNTVEVAFESVLLRIGQGIADGPKLARNLLGSLNEVEANSPAAKYAAENAARDKETRDRVAASSGGDNWLNNALTNRTYSDKNYGRYTPMVTPEAPGIDSVTGSDPARAQQYKDLQHQTADALDLTSSATERQIAVIRRADEEYATQHQGLSDLVGQHHALAEAQIAGVEAADLLREHQQEIAEATKAQVETNKAAAVIAKERAASDRQYAEDTAALQGPLTAQLEKINQIRDATIEKAQADLRAWQASATLTQANGEAGRKMEADTNATIKNATEHADAAREIVLGHETIETSTKAVQETQAALAKANTEALRDWKLHLDEVAQSWSNIGDVVGGIGGIVGQLGGGKGAGALGSAGGLFGSISGLVKGGGFGQIFGGGGADDETGEWVKDSAAQTAMKLVGGIAKAIPIAGAAVGLAQSIAGLFSHPEYEKVAEDMGRKLGADISENVAKAIADTESKDKIGRGLAEALHVADMIKDVGINEKTIGPITDMVGTLFGEIASGSSTAKEALSELGQTFNDLQTAAAGGNVASEAAMIGMIQRANELKLSLPEIDKYVKGLMDDASKNMEAFLSGQGIATTRDGKLAPGAASNAQASANNDIFNAIFDSKEATEGLVAAEQEMKPSLDALVANLDIANNPDRSLTGSAAQAAMVEEMLKNPMFAGGAKSDAAGAHIEHDLLDAGKLSQKTLGSLETSAKTFYDQELQGAKDQLGLNGKQVNIADAMRMAEEASLPMIEEMAHAQELGLKLSPDMQEMLSKASADGLLPAKTLQETGNGYLKDIRDGIFKIAGLTAPGGGVPGGGGPGGGGGPSNPGTPQYGGPPKGFDPVTHMPYWETGTSYVPSTGPAVLHEGEMVLPAPLASFVRGTAASTSSSHGGEMRLDQRDLATMAQYMAVAMMGALRANPIRSIATMDPLEVERRVKDAMKHNRL